MFDAKDGQKVVIYRPYTTTKDGRRIWAKWYGKRAFRIEIDPTCNTTELSLRISEGAGNRPFFC